MEAGAAEEASDAGVESGAGYEESEALVKYVVGLTSTEEEVALP